MKRRYPPPRVRKLLVKHDPRPSRRWFPTPPLRHLQGMIERHPQRGSPSKSPA
ncbi:hypothetical protein KCP75_02075 [Salmonella enterica subsp. enterica]|nr:hypothetical protein KCP75_02075 [Salmonella enterica subsp. enterica]